MNDKKYSCGVAFCLSSKVLPVFLIGTRTWDSLAVARGSHKQVTITVFLGIFKCPEFMVGAKPDSTTSSVAPTLLRRIFNLYRNRP